MLKPISWKRFSGRRWIVWKGDLRGMPSQHSVFNDSCLDQRWKRGKEAWGHIACGESMVATNALDLKRWGRRKRWGCRATIPKGGDVATRWGRRVILKKVGTSRLTVATSPSFRINSSRLPATVPPGGGSPPAETTILPSDFRMSRSPGLGWLDTAECWIQWTLDPWIQLNAGYSWTLDAAERWTLNAGWTLNATERWTLLNAGSWTLAERWAVSRLNAAERYERWTLNPASCIHVSCIPAVSRHPRRGEQKLTMPLKLRIQFSYQRCLKLIMEPECRLSTT